MASALHAVQDVQESRPAVHDVPAPAWSLDRRRVARELHTLGGVVAAIDVHAGLALNSLERRPAETAEALRTIAVSSRRILDEMRWLLTMVERGDDGVRAGERTLARLDTLVALSAAGQVRTEVTVVGDLLRLPSAVDEIAYSIVEDALTNVMRHADATVVRLSILCERRTLHLEISDNGTSRLDRPWTSGNGITSLHAGAESLGGHLTVDDRSVAGFRVTARLPFAASS
jgi:signal transduction histidine kinase